MLADFEHLLSSFLILYINNQALRTVLSSPHLLKLKEDNKIKSLFQG